MSFFLKISIQLFPTHFFFCTKIVQHEVVHSCFYKSLFLPPSCALVPYMCVNGSVPLIVVPGTVLW